MLHLSPFFSDGKLMKLKVYIKISVLLIFAQMPKKHSLKYPLFLRQFFRILLLQTIERADFSKKKIIPAF